MDDKEEKKVKKSKKLKKEVKICKESDDEDENEVKEKEPVPVKVKRSQKKKGNQNKKQEVKNFTGANVEPGGYVEKVKVTQIASQVIMQASPPKKEFLEGDETVLIKEIKSYYQEKNKIEIIFAETGIPIEKGGYINLAIVEEENQREKEKEALEKIDERITSFEDIYGTKTPIKLDELFFKSPIKKNKEYNSALLLGRAGIGKSTVCQYIAYQWAYGKLWKDKFDLILWIPLRNLMDKLKYSQKKINSYKVIYEECFSREFKENNDYDFNALRECIKKIPADKVLYILDGYDEVANLDPDNAAKKVISEIFLNKKHIILTSRPFYLKKNPFSHRDNTYFQRVENIGFLKEDINKYIQVFFKETVSKKNEIQIYCNSLIQFFNVSPNAKGAAHIPINLALICQAWKEHYHDFQSIKDKPITLSNLYHGILHSLCIRYLKRHQSGESIPNKSWHFISQKGRCPAILEALKELAFNQMQSKSLIIENKKIMEWIDSQDDENLFNDILDFGLLKPVNSYHIDKEKQSYYFIHLTFQEFLAASYIADYYKQEIEKEAGEEEENGNTTSMIENFIRRYKYLPHYEIMWWFVAGLLKSHENAREKFFDLLEEEESKDITGLAHQCLLIRCLDECSEAEDEGLKKRKDDFLKQLLLRINYLFQANSGQKYTRIIKVLLNYLGISQNVFHHHALQPEFVKLLKRKNDEYSNDAAIEIISEQSFLPEKMFEQFEKLLHAKDDDLRISAKSELRKQRSLPEDILNKLVELLNKEELGIYAFGILYEQLSLSENILKKLLNIFQTGNGGHRFDVARILGKHLSLHKWILKQLVQLLEDSDTGVEYLAAWILSQGPLLPPKIIERLEKLLEFEDENIKYCAAVALERQSFLHENIIVKLIKFLLIKKLRSPATNALAHQSFLSENILEQLIKLLQHDDDELRQSASDILSNQSCLPEKFLEQVVKLLGNKNFRDLAAAILNKQSFLPEKLLAQLVKLFTDKNFTGLACKILCREASLPEKLLKQLVKLLEDNDFRYFVVEILNLQSSLPETILEQLRKLLEDESQDKSLRCFVIGILRKQSILPENILELLGKLLGNEYFRPFVAFALEYKSVIPMANYLKNNPTGYLMEVFILDVLDQKIPIYKDLDNDKNIFIGVIKIEFETPEKRNQFIKQFKTILAKLMGIDVISREHNKLSEFLGGFFDHRTKKATTQSKLNTENLENDEGCLVM